MTIVIDTGTTVMEFYSMRDIEPTLNAHSMGEWEFINRGMSRGSLDGKLLHQE